MRIILANSWGDMTQTKNGFLSGAIILFFCSIVSKALGALYKIPLLKILGTTGLGEYQMILSIYALFLVISSSGITITLSKLIARETRYKNINNQKKYLRISFLITLILSSFLSLILISISPILSKFQSFKDLKICYLAIAPALIFSSLIAVFRGYFLGKRNMTFSGSVLIVEAGLKLVFSLILSSKFAYMGATGAVFGAVLGITICEVLSLLFMLILYFFKKRTKNKKSISQIVKNKSKYNKTSKPLSFNYHFLHCQNSRYVSYKNAFFEVLKVSFFVALQSCIFPLVGAIDGLVVVPLLLKTGISQSIAYSLFGIEDGVVATIVSMPIVVATSIGSALIPNIKSQKKPDVMIQNALKVVWLISIFCGTLFIFFSKGIVQFLYGSGLTSKTFSELTISSDLLKINGFNIIYISLLSVSTSILQGLDRSKIPVKNLLIASISRFIVLAFCLTNSTTNIYGIALANMVLYSVALILNLKELKRYANISFSIKNIFLLPTFSLVSVSLSLYLLKLILYPILSTKVATLLIVVSVLTLYTLLLVSTKVLNIKDIFAFRKKNN